MAQANLGVRIAANTDELKRNLAEGRAAIEALGPSVDKMAKTWAANGATVIQKANNITAALQQMGDKTITASDASRNLKALDAAMAQLRSSSQPIPPLMQQAADQMRSVSGASAGAATATTSLAGQLRSVAGTLGLAFGGAAVVSGLKNLISDTFTYAETIKDTSAKMGVSMEATQRWKFAAEQTGASLENVSKSVLKLSQGLAGGDKGLKEALAAAGVQFESLRGMKPEDAFNVVAAAIEKIPNPMLQAKVALEALGKSGTELLPAIREGMVGLAADVKTMSDETINRLDAAKDKWSELGQRMTIVSGEILTNTTNGFKKFFVFLEMSMTQGVVAAEQWRLGMIEAEKTISQLSGSSKMYAAAASKAGDSAAEIGKALKINEKSVQAYLDTLKTAPPVLDDFGKGSDAAAKKIAAFQSRVDAWNGKKAQADLAELRKEIDAAGGVAALSAAKYKALASQLVDLQAAGAPLDAEFKTIALSLSKVTWSSSTEEIKKFNQALMDTVGISWSGAAQDFRNFAQAYMDAFEGDESWSGVQDDLDRLKGILDREGASAGVSFKASLGASLSNIGNVIVGAIQGGGNVMLAVIGSIASDLGGYFSKKFAEKIAASAGADMGALAGGFLTAWLSVMGSILSDVFTEVDTALEALGKKFGTTADLVIAQLQHMGDAGRAVAAALTNDMNGFLRSLEEINALGDAEQMAGFLGQFPTQAELQKIAAQWKGVYEYMLSSGLYTAQALADAWKKYQDAMAAAAGVVVPEDTRPVGARGFPTKAELQQAAADAEAAYTYIRDSGLYTAGVVDQAFQQWQDSLAAAGNAGAAALKKIDAEMQALQSTIDAEAWEEEMGNDEKVARARLAQLEEEKAAALIVIEEETRAQEAAAVTAEASAQKAFDKTLADAKLLDGEMRRIFSQGYDIPFRFTGSGSSGVPPGGSYGGAQANGGDYVVDKPTWFMAGEAGRERATFTPMGRGGSGGGGQFSVTINNPVVRRDSDIQEITREVIRGFKRELEHQGGM